MFAIRRMYSSSSVELVKKELYQGNSVVRLILNDQKRKNALSLDMIEELAKELRGINNITKIRSVILAHEGNAFSSGHDLKELRTETGSEHHTKVFERCANLMQLIQRLQVPVIAEVNGVAAAAGCQLAASCDIVVAGTNSKFMVPGQKVGIFCSTPGIPLVRAVPRKIAMDMLLTARPLSAEEALRHGLVSRVVEPDQVKYEALKVAEEIGVHSRSVTSLGKAFFYTQVDLDTNNAYRYGSKMMVQNLRMTDAQEGISSFVEKRKPAFSHSEDHVKEEEAEKVNS